MDVLFEHEELSTQAPIFRKTYLPQNVMDEDLGHVLSPSVATASYMRGMHANERPEDRSTHDTARTVTGICMPSTVQH